MSGEDIRAAREAERAANRARLDAQRAQREQQQASLREARGTGGSSGGSHQSFGSNPLGFLVHGADQYVLNPLTGLNKDIYGLRQSQVRLGRLDIQEQRTQLQQLRLNDQIQAAQMGISVRQLQQMRQSQIGYPQVGGLPQGAIGFPQGAAPFYAQGNYVPVGQFPAQNYYVGGTRRFDRVELPVGGSSVNALGVAANYPNQQTVFAGNPWQGGQGYVRVPVAGQASAQIAAQPDAGAASQQQATTAVTPTTLSAGNGKQAHAYSLKADKANMPKIDSNQVSELQGRLIEAGFDLSTRKHPDGKDGMYGSKTEAAVRAIARDAGVNPKDIDFTNANDPETKRFYAQLDKTIAQHKGQAQQGPSAAELARRAQLQQAASVEATIPAAVRGTPYDPRYTARLSPADRIEIARHGLFAVDEIASEHGARNPETMARKLREVQKNNDLPQTGEATPETLMALGQQVAKRGGLSYGNQGASLYDGAEGRSQAEKDYIAATALHALDRTSGVTRDPEHLEREIRKFQKQHADAGLLPTGRVDDATLQVLQAEVQNRGALVTLPGYQSAIALANPAPAQRTLPEAAELPETVRIAAAAATRDLQNPVTGATQADRADTASPTAGAGTVQATPGAAVSQ